MEAIDSEDEFADEDIDPRVEGELEKLNNATSDINNLENRIEKEGNRFRSLMLESSHKLNTLAKKLGRCVNKTRPYFDAVRVADKALGEAQEAAVKFQRAMSVYKAAKETVSLAEEKMLEEDGEHRQFDSAWQEMLNHATMRFMEAELEKTKSEKLHLEKAAQCASAQQRVQHMERQWNKSIARARPYFELKEQLEADMKDQKQCIMEITQSIVAAKQTYADTLRRLEDISEEVHQQRKKRLRLPPRTPGVGAEYEPPALPEINLEGDMSQFSDLESISSSVDGLSLQDTDSGLGTGLSQSSSQAASTSSKTSDNHGGTDLLGTSSHDNPGHHVNHDSSAERQQDLVGKDTTKVFTAVARRSAEREQGKLTQADSLDMMLASDLEEGEMGQGRDLSPTEMVEGMDVKQYYNLGSMMDLLEGDTEDAAEASGQATKLMADAEANQTQEETKSHKPEEQAATAPSACDQTQQTCNKQNTATHQVEVQTAAAPPVSEQTQQKSNKQNQATHQVEGQTAAAPPISEQTQQTSNKQNTATHQVEGQTAAPPPVSEKTQQAANQQAGQSTVAPSVTNQQTKQPAATPSVSEQTAQTVAAPPVVYKIEQSTTADSQ